MAKRKMSKVVDSETRKEEAVEATTIEVASETPASPPLTSESVAEGSAEVVMESTQVESTTLSSPKVVVESVKAGATAAQQGVDDFVPAIGKNLRQLVYNGFYYVSFGVTFSALTVASLVPMDNVMREAVADGAAAAKQAFRQQHERGTASESGSTSNPASGEGTFAA
jgi:hypothetical protein